MELFVYIVAIIAIAAAFYLDQKRRELKEQVDDLNDSVGYLMGVIENSEPPNTVVAREGTITLFEGSTKKVIKNILVLTDPNNDGMLVYYDPKKEKFHELKGVAYHLEFDMPAEIENELSEDFEEETYENPVEEGSGEE